MKATDIIQRASVALFDASNVRWTVPELINYINDGQGQIVLFRPDANSITASLALVAGSKQSIPIVEGTDPAGVKTPVGIRFLRAMRNMGVDGMTPGRAIRECSRVALDNELPDWHTANPSATVQHYVFDNISPRHFYVYPSIPTTGAVYMEAVYSGLPAQVVAGVSGNPTAATDVLTLPDQYINPLLDFVLARCYAKDASYAGNMNRANMHLQAFSGSLGVTQKVNYIAASPELATPTPAAAAQARTGP